MFSQQYEEELWTIWQSRPVSVLLPMSSVLEVMHRILSEEYKAKELKFRLLFAHFQDVKSQVSIDCSDVSFENLINFVFNLSTVNSQVTIGSLLKPLSDRSLSNDVKKIVMALLETVKTSPDDGNWRSQSTCRPNISIAAKPCDIFICCSQDDRFQYLDGFIFPLLLKYDFNAIYPQRDLDAESIGLCENYISECKLCFVVITTNYYSDPLVNLFCRRALSHSNKASKKVIVAVMDYEPSFVAHARYMRPIELENAELLIYNENKIENSFREFTDIVSKTKN